jgi:large subunit ribosomal protein L35
MGKLKTHSGTKDRIKITKNGKVLSRHSMRSHFLSKKSSARKRDMAGTQEITGKIARNVKTRLGV